MPPPATIFTVAACVGEAGVEGVGFMRSSVKRMGKCGGMGFILTPQPAKRIHSPTQSVERRKSCSELIKLRLFTTAHSSSVVHQSQCSDSG